MHARSTTTASLVVRALTPLTPPPAHPSQLPPSLLAAALLLPESTTTASLPSPAAAASKLCGVLRRRHTSASMADAPLATLAEGPYVYSVLHDHVESMRQVQGGRARPVKLPLFLTLPMTASPDSAAPPGPFPVCILLNGFQVCAFGRGGRGSAVTLLSSCVATGSDSSSSSAG
jgi:hypothetical protein